MHLWISPDHENIENLYESLINIGYPEKTINYIRNERKLDDPATTKLKYDHNRLKVDLMTDAFQSEFSWKESFDQSNRIELEDVIIPVIHINLRLWMKENSERLGDSLKDLVDAQKLNKIRKINYYGLEVP